MGAAGWHLCLNVMDHLLSGTPLGRIVAGDAWTFPGWQRLHNEYLDAPQIALTVEAFLVALAMVFGWWVSRRRQPYGKGKVGVHLVFFLWFSTGCGFIATSPSWPGGPG